jgi:hypothetical protein
MITKNGGVFMKRRIPDEKKIMREMAQIAFNADEKTADRLRALDLLSDYVGRQTRTDEAFVRLDALLALMTETQE